MIRPVAIATVAGSIASGLVRVLLIDYYMPDHGYSAGYAGVGAHRSVLRFVNPYSIAYTAACCVVFALVWRAWAALRTDCRTNSGRLRVAIVVGTTLWLSGRFVIDISSVRRGSFTFDMYMWLVDVIALAPVIVWSFALASPNAPGAVGTAIARAARMSAWDSLWVGLVFFTPAAAGLRFLLTDKDIGFLMILGPIALLACWLALALGGVMALAAIRKLSRLPSA